MQLGFAHCVPGDVTIQQPVHAVWWLSEQSEATSSLPCKAGRQLGAPYDSQLLAWMNTADKFCQWDKRHSCIRVTSKLHAQHNYATLFHNTIVHIRKVSASSFYSQRQQSVHGVRKTSCMQARTIHQAAQMHTRRVNQAHFSQPKLKSSCQAKILLPAVKHCFQTVAWSACAHMTGLGLRNHNFSKAEAHEQHDVCNWKATKHNFQKSALESCGQHQANTTWPADSTHCIIAMCLWLQCVTDSALPASLPSSCHVWTWPHMWWSIFLQSVLYGCVKPCQHCITQKLSTCNG